MRPTRVSEKEYSRLGLGGEGKTVALDIGAFDGVWSQRLAVDYCKVIAFEPIEKHIENHKRNCKGFDNIKLHSCALSDNDDHLTILSEDHQVAVHARTLDSFTFDQVDFLRMDVEGHEKHVLQGGKNTIRIHQPKIYIEIRKSNYLRDFLIKEIIESYGYTLREIEKGPNYLATVT